MEDIGSSTAHMTLVAGLENYRSLQTCLLFDSVLSQKEAWPDDPQCNSYLTFIAWAQGVTHTAVF